MANSNTSGEPSTPNLSQLFSQIANSIRAKTGITGQIKAVNFPSAINGISTGVDTSNATAAAGDILSGKTAYVNGEKVTGTIASQAGATITPGTVAKTAVAKGRYTAGDVKVAGDVELQPWNIREGVSIFNVEGTVYGLPVMDEPFPCSGSINSGILSIDIPTQTKFICTRQFSFANDWYWYQDYFFAIRGSDGEWYGLHNVESETSNAPSLKMGWLNWIVNSNDGSNMTLNLAIDPEGLTVNGTFEGFCFI